MARTRTAAVGVALAGAAALGAAAMVQPVSAQEDPALQRATAVAERFVSEQAALDAGYLRTDDCTDWKHAKGIAPKGSYMGYHYVNPTLMRDGLDPNHPDAVLYTRKGRERVLTGIEYIVIDADQNLSTDGDRPSLWGHQFDGPMPGHVPGMPIHYDLHIWTHDDNPAGAWSAWNTSKDLNCP